MEYPISGTIQAYNAYGALSDPLKFRLTMANSGVLVSRNSGKNYIDKVLTDGKLKLPYNRETSISLSSVFHGQDMQIYMKINGEYPYLNETDNIIPAVILPKSEVSDDV
jgi:hypothetical protein